MSESLPPSVSGTADAEARNARVYRARNRYDMAKLLLGAFSAIAIVVLLGLVLYGQAKAAEGREEIRSCIDPTGKCAQRGRESTGHLGAAIVVCTNRLPPIVSRDEALNCIIKEATP